MGENFNHHLAGAREEGRSSCRRVVALSPKGAFRDINFIMARGTRFLSRGVCFIVVLSLWWVFLWLCVACCISSV